MLKSPFEHQGTWFGEFEAAVDMGDNSMSDRVRQYIAFSVDWHERLDAGEDRDDKVWDDFSDMTGSDQWATGDAVGLRYSIEAPVFQPDNEICWA